MSQLNDDQLARVAGGPGWNKPNPLPPHSIMDTIKLSKEMDKPREEYRKSRIKYIEDCASRGIEPRKDVMYGPCQIS